MTSNFTCKLAFTHAWKASRMEMDALVCALISSLTESGVAALAISGDISEGTFGLEFSLPLAVDAGADDPDDSLRAVGLVVRALNSGRVSAPGWPDDAVIDDAIASVKVQAFGLVAP